MGEVLLDVLIDSLKILPFLYAAYLLVEFIERRTNVIRFISGRFGSIPGAFIGMIPQCGFTPAAASLYSSGFITLGTLVAVFAATSDEALIILLSRPGMIGDVAYLMGAKLIIAVAAGLVIDLFAKGGLKKPDIKAVADGADGIDGADAQPCGCCRTQNIFYAALKHTAVIFAYIVAFFLLFELIIFFIGEERVSDFLLKGSFFQPFVTALFGFIPSCASSVILTDLYMEGTLSFASVLAGLITNSGVGIIALFKSGKSKAKAFRVVGILYFVAVLSGVIFQLF
ncbi:MAG: arsenic efflux protein [Clostridiales bacterium]|jgi:hypothetical protein|nr:arsenic efflux protein [Clostridiales bacterium]